MNNITIIPQMLSGSVKIPPSKSIAHRAIIAAALSKGECTIDNAAMSMDIEATLGGIRALGSKYTYSKKDARLNISAKKSTGRNIEIDCGESGSTLRFLIPIALLTGKKIKFTGHGRLMQRPMEPYFKMFARHGISCLTEGDCMYLDGKLTGGAYEIEGNVSSQFITGLLFALPLAEEDSEIIITTTAESKGYIDLTLDVLKKFGIKIENHNYMRYVIPGGQKYKARNFVIEGDYSQAAFFLVAGAIGGNVECLGLDEDSLQGDRAIIDIIKRTGAKIEKTKEGIRAVQTANMHGITVDAREVPDLVPIVSVLLALCRGESNIINAGRLRMKESDRLEATRSELGHLGADITEGADSLKIIGKQVLESSNVSSRSDHRIAMSLAIAAQRCEGGSITIMGAADAVKKSYPDFFDAYGKLCGQLI